MKHTFLLLILFLSGYTIYAQQDQKAKEILDKVTQTTQSYKSIEANFSFAMENKEQAVNEKYSGDVVLKGNKYVLKIEEMGLEVFSDGKNVWTYMGEANEVNISSIEGGADDNMMDPSKIFTIYKNGFNYKYIGEENKDGKNTYVIELIPQKTDNTYSQITVNIDKTKMLIYKAKMNGRDGNLYTISIDQYKTDKTYDDAFFVFDPTKHPGVELVDMR